MPINFGYGGQRTGLNPLAPRTTTRPPTTTTAPRTNTTPPTPQLPAGTDESIATTNEPTLPQLPTIPVPATTTTGGPSIPPPPPTVEPGNPTATITPTSLPSTPTQTPTTPVPAVGGINPTIGSKAGPNLGPSLTPTDPNNPLTGQTIGAGPGLNRFDLARQQFDSFVQGTDPAYQAVLRDTRRAGAAAGGLGSGMLRTSLGDAGANRELALRNERSSLFNNALTGSVDDARFATGLAERQQGFQSEQQQRAFENELRRLGFDEDLINSAFGRALGTFNAGNVGGTGSGTILTGADSAQTGANQSNDALAELIRLLSQNRTSGTSGGTGA